MHGVLLWANSQTNKVLWEVCLEMISDILLCKALWKIQQRAKPVIVVAVVYGAVLWKTVNQWSDGRLSYSVWCIDWPTASNEIRHFTILESSRTRITVDALHSYDLTSDKKRLFLFFFFCALAVNFRLVPSAARLWQLFCSTYATSSIYGLVDFRIFCFMCYSVR